MKIVFLIGVLGAFNTAIALSLDYHLKINLKVKKLVAVEVKSTKPVSFTMMADGFLDQKYHEFLTNINCFNKKKVKCIFDKNGTLKAEGGITRLTYQVKIEHENAGPKYGLDEVPHIVGKSLFLTGRAVFVYPKEDVGQIQVKVSGVSEDQSSVPWKRLGDSYSMVKKHLIDSMLLFGDQQKKTIKVGASKLKVSVGSGLLGSPHKAAANKITSTMEKIFRYHAEKFGGTPDAQFTITFDRHPDKRASGSYGGVFATSVRILLSEDLVKAQSPKMYWTPAHELLHLWNAGVIKHGDGGKGGYWFTEGATDYLTGIALLDVGIKGKDFGMPKILAHFVKKYLIQEGKASLKVASRDKNAYRPLIYGGGALATLKLDIAIREATQSKTTIHDFMRKLYAFCESKGSYDDATFKKFLGSYLGQSGAENIYAETVLSKKPFKLETLFRKIGLQLVKTKSGSKSYPYDIVLKPVKGAKPAVKIF